MIAKDLLMVSLKAFSTFLKKGATLSFDPVILHNLLVVFFAFTSSNTTLLKKVLRGSPTPEMTWHRAQRAMPGGESEVDDHDDGQHHGDDLDDDQYHGDDQHHGDDHDDKDGDDKS